MPGPASRANWKHLGPPPCHPPYAEMWQSAAPEVFGQQTESTPHRCTRCRPLPILIMIQSVRSGKNSSSGAGTKTKTLEISDLVCCRRHWSKPAGRMPRRKFFDLNRGHAEGPAKVSWALKKSGGDLLSHGRTAVSLAQRRFTVLFGMGRRGATSLWPPDISVGLQGVGLQPMSGVEQSSCWKKCGF